MGHDQIVCVAIKLRVSIHAVKQLHTFTQLQCVLYLYHAHTVIFSYIVAITM